MRHEPRATGATTKGAIATGATGATAATAATIATRPWDSIKITLAGNAENAENATLSYKNAEK